MVLKRGRFGEFMACSGYPECRNTKKIVKTAKESTVKQDIPLEEECPVCGKKLAIKHGRFGEYHGLQRLSDLQIYQTQIDRRSLRERGMHRRNCRKKVAQGQDFLWLFQLPRLRFCPLEQTVCRTHVPVCNAPFTVVKTTKRSGTVRFCNNENCDFKETVEDQ